MSSIPDAPYKSRLFNFINRQYLRWGDRWGKAVRTLQVAVVWGIQIVAYPVYLLAQTGRLLGQRLGQKVAQLASGAASQEEEEQESLTADTPIQRVLGSVVLAVPGTVSEEEALQRAILQNLSACTVAIKPLVQVERWAKRSPHPELSVREEEEMAVTLAVRGIACNLETRTLVLVASNNQVLDILSPPQQQQLQQRLIWEVANFKHRQRLSTDSAKPLRIPSAVEQDSRVLLPARWFWKVMRWVQQSPVAIAVDLFGESALMQASAASLPTFPDSKAIFAGAELIEPIAWLDGAIARLEAHPPVPPLALTQWREAVESVVQRLRDKLSVPGQAPTAPSLQALLQAAIAYFFTPQGKLSTENPESRSLLASTPSTAALAGAGEEIALNPSEVAESSVPQPFKGPGKAETLTLLYIIRAAIDYFFGNKQPIPLAPEHPEISPTAEEMPREPPSQLEATPLVRLAPEAGDTWLVWEDLYEDFTREAEEDPPILRSSTVPKTIAAGRSPHRKASRFNAPASPTPRKSRSLSSGIENNSQPSMSLSRRETTPAQPPLPPPSDPNSALSVRENSAIDPGSDWIETEATATGYAKHPLEQILEWLDRIMLAIENLLLAIWRWIYRRIP